MSPNGNWFCARHPVDKQASNSSFGLRATNLDVHEIYRASWSRLGLEDLKTFTPIGNQNLPKETSRMCLKFPTQVFVSGPVFKKGKEVKSLYRHLPTSVVSIVNFIDNLSFFWENKDGRLPPEQNKDVRTLYRHAVHRLRHQSSTKKNHRRERKRHHGYQTHDSINPSPFTALLLRISVSRSQIFSLENVLKTQIKVTTERENSTVLPKLVIRREKAQKVCLPGLDHLQKNYY